MLVSLTDIQIAHLIREFVNQILCLSCYVQANHSLVLHLVLHDMHDEHNVQSIAFDTLDPVLERILECAIASLREPPCERIHQLLVVLS